MNALTGITAVIGAIAFGAIAFVAAAGLAYGLFRWISSTGPAQTPVEMGRKWLAWVALIATVALLPKFIRTLDVNQFAAWLTNLSIWGGIAFIGGWLYGKLYKSKLLPSPRGSSAAPGPKMSLDKSRTRGVPEMTGLTRVAEIPRDAGNRNANYGTKATQAEELWARALKEYEGEHKRPGLWARLFSEAEGNEALAKANYLKVRVLELRAESQDLAAREQKENEAPPHVNPQSVSERFTQAISGSPAHHYGIAPVDDQATARDG